jgi:excisionase family DNA binding protein
MNKNNEVQGNLEPLQVKRVLNLDECCALTGYSRGHLYRLTSTRKIPHYKRGKKLLFSKEELEGWLMANRVATIDEIDAEAAAYIVGKQSKNGGQ